mmetsp:Transcript_4013/g.7484  ORF Transcript_4013/g.7484 Transcript_4013/m.7484 type:complete len:243 (-) Transcript_4013:59-787(-)
MGGGAHVAGGVKPLYSRVGRALRRQPVGLLRCGGRGQHVLRRQVLAGAVRGAHLNRVQLPSGVAVVTVSRPSSTRVAAAAAILAVALALDVVFPHHPDEVVPRYSPVKLCRAGPQSVEHRQHALRHLLHARTVHRGTRRREGGGCSGCGSGGGVAHLKVCLQRRRQGRRMQKGRGCGEGPHAAVGVACSHHLLQRPTSPVRVGPRLLPQPLQGVALGELHRRLHQRQADGSGVGACAVVELH